MISDEAAVIGMATRLNATTLNRRLIKMKRLVRKTITSTAALALVLGGLAWAGSETATESPKKTIVETAVEAGDFTTLVAAVKAAGLAETLSGEGPFTVFAPNDEAFAKLPEGTVEGLLADVPALQRVLKHHVVSGAMPAEEVVKKESLESLLGQNLAVSTEGGVSVGGATIIATDIHCSNGVIHVIDSVILPAEESAPAH